jgi:hypothetical protein
MAEYDPTTGKWIEATPEGGALIYDADPSVEADDDGPELSTNLAEKLDAAELVRIALEVVEGVEEDERSRAQWLAKRARAIEQLGLRTDLVGAVSAGGLAGISTVRHPLLLEACIRAQSNALGELLPAEGPVKVEDSDDELSGLLEDACNTYLTDVATEYVPDTDRMLFQTFAGGAGFKKGYHCPIRKRPVIEAIDAKDLIVSNNATDLMGANRVTHRIEMSRNTLRRMQLAGVYRDVSLQDPVEELDTVALKVSSMQGVAKTGMRPQDTNYTLYECYIDLDISGHEHKKDGKATGLPIPYKVTVDKSSQKVLAIVPNYDEEDEDCKKLRNFVMYPFIPMFGFWPSGFNHILGNTESALTAAWRIMLDNGMFNNFPVWLYKKGGTKNDKPIFRANPGEGIAIDSIEGKLSDSVMPVPYPQLNPAFMQLVDSMAQTGQRLGGTAEAQIGEGRQDAPVGTTLALIEQATKIMAAAHKRLHTAQAEEFVMLRELLQEDPEALWRGRTRPDNADAIIQALSDFTLSPRADPNTPSHMHRLARTAALAQRCDAKPDLYNARAVEEEILRTLGWGSPDRFMSDPNVQAQGVPQSDEVSAMQQLTMQRLASDKMKNESAVSLAQMKMQDAEANRQIKVMDIQQRAHDAEANRAAKIQEKSLDIAHSLAVHPEAQGSIS